jgi:hypothetical protein
VGDLFHDPVPACGEEADGAGREWFRLAQVEPRSGRAPAFRDQVSLLDTRSLRKILKVVC